MTMKDFHELDRVLADTRSYFDREDAIRNADGLRGIASRLGVINSELSGMNAELSGRIAELSAENARLRRRLAIIRQIGEIVVVGGILFSALFAAKSW